MFRGPGGLCEGRRYRGLGEGTWRKPLAPPPASGPSRGSLLGLLTSPPRAPGQNLWISLAFSCFREAGICAHEIASSCLNHHGDLLLLPSAARPGRRRGQDRPGQ